MRKLVALCLTALLTSCGGGGGGPEASPTPVASSAPSALPIKAGQFSMLGPIFNSSVVVESSYYPSGGSYSLFYGCAANQTCRIADFAATPQQSAGRLVIPDTCRFHYVFAYQGASFLACGNNQPADGDIYLYRSTDLTTWTIQNNGQPILRRTPGTPWAHVWNVAILPVGTRWHMLAESHSELAGMDIAYAWADPAVSMDFTPNQGPVVIPNGGNPEMFMKNGKLVAIHGLYHDRSPIDPWYVTMSTADPAKPTAWTIHRDQLLVEEPGIDVCDPSYIEVGGQALLAVSYDQNKVVELRGPALNP